MGSVKSVSVVLLASVVVACSGAAGSGLFGDVGGDAGALPGQDAGGGNDATVTDGASPRDARGSDAISPPPPPPPPPPVDAAPVDPGIHCGSTHCTPGAQECCRTGDQGAEAFHCVSAGRCQTGTSPTPIPCDDAFDCAAAGKTGQVCCATYETASNGVGDHVTDVSCVAPTDCDPLQSMITMCSLDAPTQCPTGTTCKASAQTFVGYDLCL